MAAEAYQTYDAPLIGRNSELAQISSLLADSNCRLLTLLGLGGIGKTRLAMHAAEHLASNFPDGWFFVSCASIGSIDFLVPAIAEAIGLPLFGSGDPADQLASYLVQRNLLLVIDNFDHLVEGAGIVSKLVAAAPNCKLLVTSRERLDLGMEWVLDVHGLPFALEGDLKMGLESDAAQVFLRTARRVYPDLTLGNDDQQAIVRICSLVEGMPLALELAASWVRVIPPPEIACQIENSFDMLTAHRRDLPERHRSMRAAFDASWERLSEQEREVFRKLSIFRGPFDFEAAEQIAGATLTILSMLMDKSLIRPHRPDGFELHELLRQYGLEKLSLDRAEQEATEQKHSEYYANLLTRLEQELLQGNDLKVLGQMEQFFGNIESGWHYAVQHAAAQQITHYAFCLSFYCSICILWRYAVDEFTLAIDHLRGLPSGPERDFALARLLIYKSLHQHLLSDDQSAVEDISEGLLLLSEMNNPPERERGWGLCFLGVALAGMGDYAAGRQQLEQSLAIFRSANDASFGEATALCFLTEIALAYNDPLTAVSFAESGLLLSRSIGLTVGKAQMPPYLVMGHLGLGDPRSACACLQNEVDWVEQAAHQPGFFFLLLAAGLTLVQLGQATYAVEILTAATGVLFSDWERDPRVNPVREALDALEMRLPADTFKAAQRRGQTQILLPHEKHTPRGLKPEFIERLLKILEESTGQIPSELLTEREREVLACLARGLSNEDIATELVISVGTAKRHIHNIFTKLEVSSRTQAIVRARELGLI